MLLLSPLSLTTTVMTGTIMTMMMIIMLQWWRWNDDDDDCYVCSCSACMGGTQTFNSKHWSLLGERVCLLLANQKRPLMDTRTNPPWQTELQKMVMFLLLHAHGSCFNSHHTQSHPVHLLSLCVNKTQSACRTHLSIRSISALRCLRAERSDSALNICCTSCVLPMGSDPSELTPTTRKWHPSVNGFLSTLSGSWTVNGWMCERKKGGREREM